MSIFQYKVYKVRKFHVPSFVGSFETFCDARDCAKKYSDNQSDCAYKVSDESGKTLAMYFMGDLMKDVENAKSYPTFRLPELPLESMQVGDCIRVPVEDYSTEQIKTAIGGRVPEHVRFHLRYIDHAHHTLVRRIV